MVENTFALYIHSFSSSESSSFPCFLNMGGKAGPIALSDDIFDLDNLALLLTQSRCFCNL